MIAMPPIIKMIATDPKHFFIALAIVLSYQLLRGWKHGKDIRRRHNRH